jgi:hypothetical protein
MPFRLLVVARSIENAMLAPRDAQLVLGVLADPANAASRDAMRRTWLLDPAVTTGAAIVRFVIGALAPCAQDTLGEARSHGDVAYVNTSDCAPWHASSKVHAWFAYALLRFPSTPWFGKAEDDSMLRVGSLLADLALLRSSSSARHVLYGANMQWIAHCRQRRSAARARSGAVDPTTWSRRTCAQGCWLGTLAREITSSGRSRPARCERGFDGAAVLPGSADCPILPYAPFAPGPLDVRSAPLARLVATCGYARSYFASMVTRAPRAPEPLPHMAHMLLGHSRLSWHARACMCCVCTRMLVCTWLQAEPSSPTSAHRPTARRGTRWASACRRQPPSWSSRTRALGVRPTRRRPQRAVWPPPPPPPTPRTPRCGCAQPSGARTHPRPLATPTPT